ncbi:MAG: hypothetical protein ACI89X_003975, partial [Planctomycetota bacterium]
HLDPLRQRTARPSPFRLLLPRIRVRYPVQTANRFGCRNL